MIPRTPAGRALDALAAELHAFGRDPELQDDEWVGSVLDAFVATPFVWPMNEELYEILLTWAGFDLHLADSLGSAVIVTRMLVGLGSCPLTCTHGDDPSPLCARMRTDENIEFEQVGAEARSSERVAELLRVRAEREQGDTGESCAA